MSDGLADGPVHVAEGRIVSVGGPPQPAGLVIDARGGTVLPGLIDAHCHAYGISLDMMAMESQPLSYVAARGAAVAATTPDSATAPAATTEPAVLSRRM